MSISLAAAGIFVSRKLSGNQTILAVSVMAGTYRVEQTKKESMCDILWKTKVKETNILQNTFLQTSSNDL